MDGPRPEMAALTALYPVVPPTPTGGPGCGFCGSPGDARCRRCDVELCRRHIPFSAEWRAPRDHRHAIRPPEARPATLLPTSELAAVADRAYRRDRETVVCDPCRCRAARDELTSYSPPAWPRDPLDEAVEMARAGVWNLESHRRVVGLGVDAVLDALVRRALDRDRPLRVPAHVPAGWWPRIRLGRGRKRVKVWVPCRALVETTERGVPRLAVLYDGTCCVGERAERAPKGTALPRPRPVETSEFDPACFVYSVVTTIADVPHESPPKPAADAATLSPPPPPPPVPRLLAETLAESVPSPDVDADGIGHTERIVRERVDPATFDAAAYVRAAPEGRPWDYDPWAPHESFLYWGEAADRCDRCGSPTAGASCSDCGAKLCHDHRSTRRDALTLVEPFPPADLADFDGLPVTEEMAVALDAYLDDGGHGGSRTERDRCDACRRRRALRSLEARTMPEWPDDPYERALAMARRGVLNCAAVAPLDRVDRTSLLRGIVDDLDAAPPRWRDVVIDSGPARGSVEWPSRWTLHLGTATLHRLNDGSPYVAGRFDPAPVGGGLPRPHAVDVDELAAQIDPRRLAFVSICHRSPVRVAPMLPHDRWGGWKRRTFPGRW